MGKHLRKAVIAGAVALAFGSSAFADVTLSNGSITAVVNDSGTFASFADTGGSTPAAGTPGLMYNGNEFVNWGSPISWYQIDAGGSYATSYNIAGLPGTTTTSGGGIFSITSNLGSLTFVQTMSLVASNQLAVTVQLTNNSSTALSGVKYSVGFDPDQGNSVGGYDGYDYSTVNTIDDQGSNAGVKAAYGALGPDGTVLLRNTTSASAYSIAAYIDTTSCCSVIPAATILGGGQAAGFSATGDYGIGLGYDLGTLAASGGTASIGYSYIFAPVPEPETYAMLLAGLGLMGFVARRRQRKLAA